MTFAQAKKRISDSSLSLVQKKIAAILLKINGVQSAIEFVEKMEAL
jgi:prefoldin subunit 5